VLDKSVSANGNPKANVAVIYKGLGGEQGTDVCEGGISSEQVSKCKCVPHGNLPQNQIVPKCLSSKVFSEK
jgi:hypothetical protein